MPPPPPVAAPPVVPPVVPPPPVAPPLSPKYKEDAQPQVPQAEPYMGTPGGVGATVAQAGPQGATPVRNSILEMLRGVQVPKPPEAQKVSTPSVPAHRGTIEGGGLLALLQALQAQRTGAGAGLPATLGQAIK